MLDFASILKNLLSPAFLLFWLGLVIKHMVPSYRLPRGLHGILSFFLLVAIGFKGGCTMAAHSGSFQDLFLILGGLLIGVTLPFLAYSFLQATPLDKATKAAVAAHYGSISVVTFATALNLVTAMGWEYNGVMIALMALLEAPAIFSGLYLAKGESEAGKGHYLHPSLLLLTGGFLIGAISPVQTSLPLKECFEVLFPGALALFLFSMGVEVRKRGQDMKSLPYSLLFFGIYMPLVGAFIGAGLAYLLHLDIGTTLLLMTLCASASYIAVPATMQMALPTANSAVYLPLVLAVTFPFNVTLGIPLYLLIAKWICGG
jgi:uncharacterized protein